MSNKDRADMLDALSTGAALVGATAAVTAGVAASGVALGVAAVAGGAMIAANVTNRMFYSDKATRQPVRQADTHSMK